uniref:Protein PHYTOCHROME KINASE SUBSTRATE 4 n=1 Tax=Oryza brachyantha TaxID=4533 RepID=J3KYJ4_ORYBR
MDRYRVAPRPVYLSSAGSDGAGALPLRPRGPAGVSGRRAGGAELDIFSAERYFNADDVVKNKCGDPAVAAEEEEERPQDVASQSGRTMASSEASWNSRSGLLSSHAAQFAAAVGKVQSGGGASATAGANAVPAASGHRGKKPGSGQRGGLFSRDCPCAGRKAVTVDVASEPRSPVTPRTHARFDNSHVVADSTIFKAKAPPPPCEEEPVKMKISPGSSAFRPPLANNIFSAAPNRGSGGPPFSAFPVPDIGRGVVSSGGFTFPVAVGGTKVVNSIVYDPPRESLEGFRPIDEGWAPAPPPADPRAAGGRGGGGGLAAGLARAPGVAAVTDEEAMSDASSDLFDLESFAASSSYPTTYRGRGSRRNSREDDDDAGAAVEPAMSECMYAPSEVSVVWSVATAEGGAFDAASMANFSSAASACCVEEFSFVPAAAAGQEGFTAAMSRSAGRKKGGGGGFLNSCRCEKAVSVGPTPVRVVRPPGAAGPEVTVKASGAAERLRHGGVHMPVRT